MMTIIFESHSTTFDNEAHVSSGHNDVALSPLGIKQAQELGERYKDEFLDDLKKKYDSKKIMVIGHRATQYGLEHWVNGVSIKDAVSAFWQWQPGWFYKF